MGCIYKLTCAPTEKIYVGKTVKTARRRWHEHLADVRRGARGCNYLHNAIKKYGADNFIVETLVESDDKLELIELEKFWIATLKSQDSNIGMNLTSGGDGAPNPTPERREKLRQSMLGNEFRKGLPSANKGTPHSPEQIVKLRANYWEKRENADQIKEMLRQQAGNRKGKRKPPPEIKMCSRCKIEKAANMFSNTSDGYLDSRCKVCNAERTALRRLNG